MKAFIFQINAVVCPLVKILIYGFDTFLSIAIPVLINLLALFVKKDKREFIWLRTILTVVGLIIALVISYRNGVDSKASKQKAQNAEDLLVQTKAKIDSQITIINEGFKNLHNQITKSDVGDSGTLAVFEYLQTQVNRISVKYNNNNKVHGTSPDTGVTQKNLIKVNPAPTNLKYQ